MTGVELLAYIKRRLRLTGVPTENAAELDAELYDLATEGRDTLIQVFAKVAPVVVRSYVTLETVAGSNLWTFPVATKDPLRILVVRDSTTLEPLTPSADDMVDMDGGDYQWETPRNLRAPDGLGLTGSVQIAAVLSQAAITAATTEPNIGLPVPCHRALGKCAVMLYQSGDEDADPRNATGLFTAELSRLAGLYGEFDRNGGEGLRQAFLGAFSAWQGDTLY